LVLLRDKVVYLVDWRDHHEIACFDSNINPELQV